MDDDELVKEFLVESHENLDQLDQDLVTLEADPTNPEVLSRVFRTIHTIKGTCGFLGFNKLEWVTHVGENLLSRMRDGELLLNAEITTALLSLVDAVREILGSIETTEREGTTDYDPLITSLNRLLESEAVADDAPAAVTRVTLDTDEEVDARLTIAVNDDEMSFDVPTVPPDGRSDRHVEQFLMESYEHTDQLDQDLVTLENDSTNQELLVRIVGTLHTIKSSSGFLGFNGTEAAAHAGESLLVQLRDGTRRLSPEITTALLSLVDTLRQALVAIETSGNEQEVDFTPLLGTLMRLQDSPEAAAMQTSKSAAPQWDNGDEADDRAISPDAATVIDAESTPGAVASDAVHPQVAPATPTAKDAATAPTVRTQSIADTSIRVDVGLLDRLMDQVGELVLARNRIMQLANHQEDRSVIAAYQRLDGITSELQEGVMKTRMQPIGTIWNKFPRVVRDLARDCGKIVELSMVGEETELDKTLIEAIRDPLTHLVRNAVDHGIETPEARRQAGKTEGGSLFLRAFHEGGQVNIGISDDGGGINPERILQLALERKLITAGQAAQMGEKEVLNLIFTPGFSTAKNVTNVSGRGVGMDVVKNNIEKIKGTIDIESQVGVGSTIRIRIPLTLAIIPALIIRCAGDRYAIPQASLIELVRLEGDETRSKIETLQGSPVYRLRGKLLPLVDLREEFAVASTSRSGQSDHHDNVINIVVLQADQRQFGLIVDNVLDTEEIVVKPLGKQLKEIPVFAGATIMGDGDVALILDVLGLAQRAHVVSERREALPTDTSVSNEGQTDNRQKLLLFASDAGERMAIPLSRVTRLEKFPAHDVERSGQFEVVQYWGQVMPLIHVSQCLSGTPTPPSSTDSLDPQQDTREVVVLTIDSRCIGLVVDHILDTVEDVFEIEPLRSREGVIGTVVVHGQVTEMLDVDEIIQKAIPEVFAQLASVAREG